MRRFLFWIHACIGVAGVMCSALFIEALNWLPLACLIVGIVGLATAFCLDPQYILKFLREQEGDDFDAIEYGID